MLTTHTKKIQEERSHFLSRTQSKTVTMFSNISIQPAGTLGPQEYSHRREQILDRIAKMHHMKKTAKTPHAKEAYQKEIAHEIILLNLLNEQQQAETHDLELEEWIEPGFELVDMNA